MKKLLIVSGSMNRGGAERVISILSNELVKRDWKIIIVTILDSGCGYQLDSQIKLINISKKGQNQILSIPKLSRKIRKIIKEESPEAVVSFMVAVNIVTWLATRGLKTRFIPSERNDPSMGRSHIIKILQRFTYRCSTVTVFQTDRARKYFSKKIQNNSIVIPNPINVSVFANKIRKKKIVSVGRLEPQKNQELLIRAFSEVHSVYPEYTLEIFGEGSLRNYLQQLINSLDLIDCVKLKGAYENIHEQISDAGMFVLSSNYEGLSNALLEAMMMGLPCISTNCFGSDEAIDNHKNGIIVNVGDMNQLIDAMKFLIEHQSKASEFALKGQLDSNRYSIARVISLWESIL